MLIALKGSALYSNGVSFILIVSLTDIPGMDHLVYLTFSTLADFRELFLPWHTLVNSYRISSQFVPILRDLIP